MTDQERQNMAWMRRMRANLARRRRGEQVAGPIDQPREEKPLDMRMTVRRDGQERGGNRGS